MTELPGKARRLPEPMTDEQIAHVTVGSAPKQLNGPVALEDYNPAWPLLFEREKDRIKSALGEKAILIEHVGSTSVPGLAAKPIVDILLVVEKTADEGSYVPDLESAGYILRVREPEWHEHRLFKGPDTNLNLHVFSRGDGEIDRMLTFRDRLRADKGDRELYERTKRELATRTWKYVQNYADAKSEVVASILERAVADRR